jgi:hypothetical protein
VLTLAALKRISKADADNLVVKLNELEAYIIKMEEKPNGLERALW